MPTQTDSGKAFEYQLAMELAKFLEKPFLDSTAKEIAKAAFNAHSIIEQGKIQRAADEATVFLCNHDDRFKKAVSITLQDDKQGKLGDVRDVLVNLSEGNPIGISAKNRHEAIKHSRLSGTIDFGKEWAEYPCSQDYMKRVKPVFDDLRQKKTEGLLFRDIPDKVNRYYLPVLMAFEDELRRLTEDFGQRFVTRMFQYLLGRHDFYKVIKENGHVAIHSFNITGELKWGSKWHIPDRIDSITRKRGSSNTLIVSFVGGWQLSFRIHNASSRVEPSLKFDIQFIGTPNYINRHVIDLVQQIIESV
jgi:hypothetical protein